MSRKDFEEDLDAVFGERGIEFVPKLRTMLYRLWREGRKRGVSYERDVQIKHIQALPKTPVEAATYQIEETYRTSKEWVEWDSVPKSARGPQPEPQGQSHSETFRRILIGEENIIKVPKGSTPKRKDYLGRDLDGFGQEFFSQFLGGLDIKTKKTKI